MCILEKSTTQKVIVPANFSNTPVFETSGQNISLACMPGTTLIGILLNPWFFFIIKKIANIHKPYHIFFISNLLPTITTLIKKNMFFDDI